MKRWPIIRHIRYYWLAWRAGRVLARYGRHSYLIVSVEDALYLQDVWRGRA